jgi:ubiquinone/menaquinone biosynthesis C-methylase UbiE
LRHSARGRAVAQTNGRTFDRIASPYDRGMAPLERMGLARMRARLLPHARGQVLEVGVGTGVNLPLYPASTCVTAIDESPDMLDVAARRAASLDHCVHLALTDIEALAFPAGHFDTVVASLVFCSVIDQTRALAELRRVLCTPGGRLLLLEHMRPQLRPLAWIADLLNVPWYAFNGRCHLNRETQQAVTHAGFELEQVDSILGGLVRAIVARAT